MAMWEVTDKQLRVQGGRGMGGGNEEGERVADSAMAFGLDITIFDKKTSQLIT